MHAMHADACTGQASWQLIECQLHSNGHKNFAGRRFLENLYATTRLEPRPHPSHPINVGLFQDGLSLLY